MDFEKLKDNKRIDLLADISNQYYNLGKTQSEIAAYYNTNRFKIANLLQIARNEHIVEININYSNETAPAIEKELMNSFPLKRAIVVDTQFSPYIDSIRQIGKVGADYINRLIQPASIMGITWGKTIYSVFSQLQSINHLPVSIVQLTGSFNCSSPIAESRSLVQLIASAYNGSYYYLDAPLYIKNQKLRDLFLMEPALQNTITLSNNMDIVVTGIGGKSSLPITNPRFAPYITKEELEQEKNFPGSIYGYVLDSNGSIADIPLNQKLITVPLENIQKTPHRLAVVYGRHKAEITAKAIQNNLINELLTDTDTARNLLKYAR